MENTTERNNILNSSGQSENSLGIPSNGFIYHKIKNNQNIIYEAEITNQFLNNSKVELEKHFGKIYNFKFINYGDTQLVYVMVTQKGNFSVLVSQPSVELGTVLEEYKNLQQLSLNNSKYIVNPITYLSYKNRELYVTPYIYQARCIASQEIGWGAYIPEPYYHFKPYSDEERFNINSCIIALLINSFDEEKKLGIASCKIGGGDFILEKEWENHFLNQINTLNRLKLIAARKLLKLELHDYITLIRKEFSKSTYYLSEDKRDISILINQKSRIPMLEDEIECGIELGLKLRGNKI